MKVSELIARLQEMPADADVLSFWDGGCRSDAADVWLAAGGHVAIADDGDRSLAEGKDAPVRADRKCRCQVARSKGFGMMCLVCTGPVAEG